MNQGQEELSFVYFPENYRWSHGLLVALNTAPWGPLFRLSFGQASCPAHVQPFTLKPPVSMQPPSVALPWHLPV